MGMRFAITHWLFIGVGGRIPPLLDCSRQIICLLAARARVTFPASLTIFHRQSEAFPQPPLPVIHRFHLP
jgi:hypothetical protein